jgi:hypothetical protein
VCVCLCVCQCAKIEDPLPICTREPISDMGSLVKPSMFVGRYVGIYVRREVGM